MGAFVLQRLVWGVFTVWAISLIVFAIFFMLPGGDMAQRLAGKTPTEEAVAQIRADWRLDDGPVAQYTSLMGKLVSGELVSPTMNTNVVPLVVKAIPATASLAFFAALIWLAVGITFGNIGALRPGSRVDRSLMVVALAGVSIPMAWLSIYSLKLWTDMVRVFPPGGYLPVSEGGIFGWLFHILLPASTLAVVFAGVYARMSRSNIRQALRDEHVKTAVAKGLPGGHVHVHHVLRTALIPIVVMLGLDVAALLGGAIFTETIFGLPGLGAVAMSGIAQQDPALLTVWAIVAATFVVLANLVVDIVQAALDPRIRHA